MFYRWEKKKKTTGDPIKDLKKVIYYDYHEVDDFLEKLDLDGYECIQTSEGTLGSGDWICVPPCEGFYYYVIREIAINSQCSGHRVHRMKKLTKAYSEELYAFNN